MLEHANAARTDPDVAPDATYLMLDTYLAPCVDAVWAGERLDAAATATALENCGQLLRALPPSERNGTRWQVRARQRNLFAAPCAQLSRNLRGVNTADAALQAVHATVLTVTPGGDGVRDALAVLLPAAKAAPDGVAVLLAIATAFVRAGQVPKARNQLKRIQARAAPRAALRE